MIAYSVAQRTQEIGIRMAIGAQRRDVLWLVLLGGLRLVALGVALGLAGAFALTRLLQTLLFGVTAHDPLVFAGNAALLLVVATLACVLPALRATARQPDHRAARRVRRDEYVAQAFPLRSPMRRASFGEARRSAASASRQACPRARKAGPKAGAATGKRALP